MSPARARSGTARALLRPFVLLAVVLVGCGTDGDLAPNARQAPTATRGEVESAEPADERPVVDAGFQTLPPGAPLPSEQDCAARVPRSNREPRPENRDENQSAPSEVNLPEHPDFQPAWQIGYKSRITGRFTGTTDEIIQWAACKWGLEANVLRAQAVEESGWRMSEEGDREPASKGVCVAGDTRDPCPTSFGILQIKWYFNPGAYPLAVDSTAFHLDFAGAMLRGCFDGLKHVGEEYAPGDLWGCLGNWWSGGWDDEGARRYIERVKTSYEAKPWRDWLE